MTSQAVQLGAELRQQRRRAGMTVVQVGEALGFHHSTISRWERGETMPDESDTGAVLAICGCVARSAAAWSSWPA
jgi:transcriptional regulator with XRE-family HTH domain